MGENKCRTVYNNIKATNNLVSVCNVKAKDLQITDTDRFTYLLTYSFPCQDLSVGGQQKGMERGSGTRSGLLWEVERILKDCNELPQILIMENVPQIINAKNRKTFNSWLDELEKLGYRSYYNVMNGKEYGMCQQRERCFMVSILGDYIYSFPKPIHMKKELKDLIEEEVDEKFYLSEKGLKYLFDRMPTLTNVENNGEFYDSVIRPPHGWNDGEWKKSKIVPTIDTGMGKWHILLGKSNIAIFDSYNAKQINEDIIGTLTASCANNGSGTFCVKQVEKPVRRLTPKECFRFMGVKDADFEFVEKNQSNTSLYHLAGDSIITNCLMAIFGELFDVDWRSKIEELMEDIKCTKYI
jgi:DNA (cytosine-5)-methyltransferase 1